MMSILVEYDSREDHPSRSREGIVEKAEEAEGSGSNIVLTPVRKKPRTSKKSRFEGMTLKESYEAFGMDMGWTNYSTLVMERPTPGIYVTPKGKARPFHNPLGRGRHREPSQIAIFKTTKLSQLPWFQAETEGDATPSEPVLSQEVSGENKGTAPVHIAEGFTESSSHPNHLDERSRIGRHPLRPFDLQAIRDNSTAHETVSESSQQIHPTFEVAPTILPPKGASSSNRKKSKSHHYEKKGKAAVYNVGEAIASSSKSLGHDIENTSEAQLPRDKDSNHIPGVWPEDPTSEAVPAEKPHKTAVPEATRAKGKNAPVAYDLPSETASSDALSQKLPSDDGENPISQNDVNLPDAEPALFMEVWPPKEVSSKDYQDTVTPEVQQSEDENVVNVIGNPSDVAAGESHGVSTEISTRPEEEDVHVEDNTTPNNEKKEDGINITPIPNEAVEGPYRKESQAFSSRSRKLRVDRGGSIAVLRREIVMDIVKKAGGAFPLGTELWHAFITVWMKTDHKEKPDARTVRSTARYLIDAGKLRQQTFSGKDNKGVMVTKDIIMDPAISPDDPVVKKLQKDMLAAGKYFLPAGVEVNPRVSKASRMAAPAAPRGRIQKLPFQAGITVQLHQKPAFVIAQEKREARSLQRRLFRAMESGTEHGDQFGGPIRLRTIQRSRRVDGKTSVSRPAFRIAPNGQPGQIPGTLSWLGASSMEATSGQVPVEHVTRYELFGNKRRMIPQSLEEIFTQVKRRKTTASASSDPRTAEFFKESDDISKWELQNETLFESKGEKLAYINQTVSGAFEAAPVEGGIHFDIDEISMPPPPLPRRKITRQVARAPRRDSGLQLRQLAAASPVEPLPVVWPPPEQADGELDRDAMAQNTKQPAARAPFRRRSRKASNLPESLILKLKHAIVVIQMLLGGGTSIIDWAVVTSIFPDYDPEVIHKRGKAIALRDKEQLKQMAAHFDEAFIPAYLNDEVPSVNYDDLESYPWDTVVEWAMAQSDIRPSQRVPELPATREEFDRLYELRLDRPIFKDIHTLFTNNPKMTVAKRQALLASVPYVVPLKDKWSKRTEPTDKNLVKDSTVQEKIIHQDVTTSPTQDIAMKQESSTTAQKETLSQSATATKQPDENNLQDETTTVPKTRSTPEEVTTSITKDEATPIEETTYVAPAEPSISQETSDRDWNAVRPETDDQTDDMLQDESHTAEAEPVGKAAEVAPSQQDAVQDEDSSESELSEHGSSEFDSSEEEWIDVIPKMDDTLQDIHVQNTDAVQQDEHVASTVPGTSRPEDSHVQQDVNVAPEPPVAWQPEGSPKQGPAPTLQQEVQVQEMTITPEVDMEDAPLDTSQQDISSLQERATEQNGDTMDIDGPEYVARDGQNAAQTARRAKIEQLEVAKSWVRANVVARDDTYNAANAKWHLDRFPAPLINDALTALITERVIAQSNRGRITPGRNYTMTELFLSTLGKRRAIDSTMLHEASEFKRRVLDYDLRYHGFSEVRYNARDGDILALICLAEDRRIHISPANEPREPFGMTEGGYETRVIDKKKYHFAVRVRPVRGRYDYGNPVRGGIAHLPPPKGSARYAISPASPAPPPWRPGELPAKPPLWYGINGGLVKSVWDLCVSSVVGIIAVRPHLDAAGIVDMVRPMMATWDVEHILGWLHEAGVLVPVGKGWVVREYWWMVVV
jgi:transcription factor C subunit 3